MWIELIRSYCEDCEFSESASSKDIETVEHELNVSLPGSLTSVLLESNGIVGENGLGLLWATDRIRSENLNFRTREDFKGLYMPFDHLLFFADAGNGDQFAYPIQNGQINRNDIFVWNHEDDRRTWAAPDLKRYFEWWLTGEMGI